MGWSCPKCVLGPKTAYFEQVVARLERVREQNDATMAELAAEHIAEIWTMKTMCKCFQNTLHRDLELEQEFQVRGCTGDMWLFRARFSQVVARLGRVREHNDAMMAELE